MAESRVCRRSAARSGALLQAVAQRPGARCGTSAAQASAQFARQERDRGFVPDRLRAGLRTQVDGRTPAAGTGDQIASQAARPAGDLESSAPFFKPGDERTFNTLAERFHHPVTADHLDASGPRPLLTLAFQPRPSIHDRHHFPANAPPIQRHVVGVVVGGEEQQLLARRHGVAIEVSAHGRGEHHARQIVVGEDERPLHSAGGENGLLGADAVQTASGAALFDGRRQVISARFQGREEAVVVAAEDGGARQQHRIERPQLGNRIGDPPLYFDRANRLQVSRRKQAAPRFGLFIGKHHPRPGPRRFKRGGETRRASADHQHVDLLVQVVVDVRVALRRRIAQPSRVPQ